MPFAAQPYAQPPFSYFSFRGHFSRQRARLSRQERPCRNSPPFGPAVVVFVLMQANWLPQASQAVSPDSSCQAAACRSGRDSCAAPPVAVPTGRRLVRTAVERSAGLVERSAQGGWVRWSSRKGNGRSQAFLFLDRPQYQRVMTTLRSQ